MSDFTYQPAYGADEQHEPRVRVAKFGDNYEQRVGDGINNDPQTWELTFNRETADIAAIATFLELKGAETAFTWTPEGGSEITVVCRRWSRTRTTIGVQSVRATFEQVPA